jgi:hypothetical protein
VDEYWQKYIADRKASHIDDRVERTKSLIEVFPGKGILAMKGEKKSKINASGRVT